MQKSKLKVAPRLVLGKKKENKMWKRGKGLLTLRGRCLFSAILLWSATTVSLQAKQVVKPKISPNVIPVQIKQGTPHEINYQGWLGSATDTTGITDTLGMIFRIYTTPTGGSHVWSESHIAVPIDKGIFNVMLGETTPLPANIFTGAPLWIETQVMTDTLKPRKKLVSVGYAIKAEKADTADYALSANINYVDSAGVSANSWNWNNNTWGTEYPQANRADTATYADTADYAVTSPNDSDWIVSGTNMYSGVSGNVGIGTTNPGSYKLRVAGEARVDDRFYLGQDLVVEGTQIFLENNNALWKNSGELLHGLSPGFDFQTFYSDGIERMRIGINGNVGIGTTSPAEKLHVEGNATVTGNLTANGVSMGKIYLTTDGTIISTDGGTRVLLWDKTNGEIEITNTSGDWCDYWWQVQKGATTSGGSGAIATGSSNIAIITGTNTNDYGFEVHFGHADGQEGWCSVWLQYANGKLVGHYIKY